jgi:hypothetical protein
LVNVCKEYLSELSVVHDNEDYFWPTIFKEIEENYNTLSSTDSQDTAVNLNASVNINFYFESIDFSRQLIYFCAFQKK